MTTLQKYHYVYRITNIIKNKHYYGVRTSSIHPSNDLGIKYFSSSSLKDFISEQKESPSNFKYKILKIFSSRTEALNFEIKLHNKFNVHINPNFYNLAKQTSTGFDPFGITPEGKLKLGHKKGKCQPESLKKLLSEKAILRYKNPENRLKQSLALSDEKRKDMSFNNKQFRHTPENIELFKRIKTGKNHSPETKKLLSDNNKNFIAIIDWEGNYFRVRNNDPLLSNYEYGGVNSKKLLGIDPAGNIYKIRSINTFCKTFGFSPHIITNRKNVLIQSKLYSNMNGWLFKVID